MAKENMGTRVRSPIASELDFVVTEAYNLMRTNLMLSFPDTVGGKAIGITSPLPQDGKSYTSINLSYALAKDGHKTLLVSTDMRKPSIETIVGQNADIGLSDILAGNASVADCITVSQLHNSLYILSAGSIPPTPSELLGSKNMLDLLTLLKSKFDYIIFDLPPVLSVADPIILGSRIDGMIVVVRHMKSKKQNIAKVVSQLKYAGIRIVGLVYNAYRSGGNGYYKNKNYYGGYGYYYKRKSNE